MTECSRFGLQFAGEMEGLEGHPSELITSAPGSPALQKWFHFKFGEQGGIDLPFQSKPI